MLGYGIPGIGYNSYSNALGTYGLGGGNMYTSYADPMMSGLSPYSMGGMGMMGMYNPAFMGQMNQAYQDIEKSQLAHTGAMHQLMLQNNTQAFTDQDRAIFEKAMVDAGVNEGITNLEAKIREGDQDGICEEFDKLKQTLYTKYNDYFQANSDKMNPSVSVSNFISLLYGKIVSAQRGGEPVDLRSDIKKYGQSAFEHGFWKQLHGKDYHDKYTEETMSYLFGTTVDNKAGKDRMQKFGGYIESGAEALAATAAGYGAAVTLAGITKAFNPFGLCEKLGLKGTHRFGKIAAGAALIGDILWQYSRS